jgi:hypothetical protein
MLNILALKKWKIHYLSGKDTMNHTRKLYSFQTRHETGVCQVREESECSKKLNCYSSISLWQKDLIVPIAGKI